ncbi:hypothetical protein L209DRAFT_452238 [Thermothelomyces heterothallicus CBS 203.75]
MTMTDEVLDRDWQPNGRRPQSTVAQMFSQELQDIFRIENSVTDLDEQVNKRKQQISSQTSELEALEARIREMEARLKGVAARTTNAPPAPPEKNDPTADQDRARDQQHQQQKKQQQTYPGSRPGTAHKGQPAVPGGLPPTPAGSEGEFEPSALSPSAIAPRPPGTRAQSHLDTSSTSPASASQTNRLPVPGGDADSVRSLSESASFADYVIVPGPDGDRERDD